MKVKTYRTFVASGVMLGIVIGFASGALLGLLVGLHG